MTPIPEPSTPSSQSFFMPAEWEQHSSTWLAWPLNVDTWKPDDLREVENIYIEIIRNLVTGEHINILIENESSQNRITSLLDAIGLNTRQTVSYTHLTLPTKRIV